MRDYVEITDCFAREILDSRGNPTVEAEIRTESGCATASVPSGASCGVYEAAELRDGLRDRYNGMGVETAVENVNTRIADAVIGMNVFDQRAIDQKMCRLDGTLNKGRLGANAILAVSLACAKAAAAASGQSLYRYIGGCNAHIMPMPMMNILNGGVHADNNLDIQEFMIMPVNASCLRAAVRMSAEVYQSLKKLLKSKGYSTAVGDEGGFAPMLSGNEEALDLIIEAVGNAGYKTGHDFKIALDAASSEWYQADGTYKMPKSGIHLTKTELADYWEKLVEKYPIISLEDGAGEDDTETWKILTERLGGKIQLVGDDLFVTNSSRLKKGIGEKIANSILVKVNQIGTLTEALDAVHTAHINGYTAILSHRSGETEDSVIADIAVAVNAGQIKTGAPCRSERVAKYNRLLRIEEELCGTKEYVGENVILKDYSEKCKCGGNCGCGD
ncbi:MAG: phosphopyruvate hydratase [Oscillospiraceae bacterium]|nr:phosphopyruvate hydratase [Oscillospiraceae bacterium]